MLDVSRGKVYPENGHSQEAARRSGSSRSDDPLDEAEGGRRARYCQGRATNSMRGFLLAVGSVFPETLTSKVTTFRAIVEGIHRFRFSFFRALRKRQPRVSRRYI